MAKYSTGSGGGGAGESCELCGASDKDLREATVAGATLQVCPDCAEHGDGETRGASGSRDDQDRDRDRRAAQNAAKIHDAAQGDSTHWEEHGTDYEGDQLPYLVRDYGRRVVEARQEAGLQTEELAEEIDEDEADVLAVEQGRATQANVGGSVVGKLEEYLDVELSEER